MKPTILALCCSLVSLSAGAGDLPGPDTPGAINPAVTQDNIHQTICVSGWTKTVRPPVSYTNKLKATQMKALGMNIAPNLAEEDHRIPLECAGHPTDPRNLSPELWDGPYGAHVKDVTESYEKRRVCLGQITLAQCQAIFMGDWRTEYDRVYGPRGPKN
jgi:hypothetical protein